MVVQFDRDHLEHLASAFGEFQELRALLDLSQSGIEFMNFDTDYAIARMADIRDTTGPDQILIFLKLLTRMATHSKKTLSVLKLAHPDGGSKQARVCQVVNFIMDNFSEDISVDAAADMAGMCPTTFSQNFQAVTGNRFVEFVIRVRVGQACSRLYATDEQISSICFGVGFQNLVNFNCHF
jgi:AraC-like DNA-binding protein